MQGTYDTFVDISAAVNNIAAVAPKLNKFSIEHCSKGAR